MRQLHNSGAEWLWDTREIGQAEQDLWYRCYRADGGAEHRVFLYWARRTVIGYGYWHPHPDCPGGTITLVVAPEQRGQGYGRMIYRDLGGRFPDARAAIRVDNVASRKAATAAGWEQLIFSSPEVVIYVWSGQRDSTVQGLQRPRSGAGDGRRAGQRLHRGRAPSETVRDAHPQDPRVADDPPGSQ